ncbi:TonB family protein [Bradyrhizobium archetypum]|uniref:Energy transducer TonB n=1 Tax=Bradyrhizobium archetypum TaxID=2721160 RepID=A0A7Y4M219_9BRAD|nr:energy transducer TonB [Bradyrhizobium archetypum]NOJ47278.1 energy transducer TonB [Bradyrhizobium archetypum]
MNAFALHDASDQAVLRRWGVSAFAILAVHAALVALAMNWMTQRPVPGVSVPVIMIDMAPVSSAPQPTQMDLTPGPVMQQADASPPPEAAQQEVVKEQIAPTPPQEKPEVVAPPEQKSEPTPPKMEPAKVEPEKKPSPVKPKAVRAEARKPSDAPPAPRTAASPKAERQAPAASAAAGASAAALASYRQMVAAHLQRFKQYPPAAKAAGQQGTARVSFTLSRSGSVTSVSLGGSSGYAALDAETLAMVRRAQPFPAFPADVKQSSMPFSAPVAFTVR